LDDKNTDQFSIPNYSHNLLRHLKLTAIANFANSAHLDES